MLAAILFLPCVLAAVLLPNPNLPLPIELSVTNVNTVGTYWFNFQTQVQLDVGSLLYIKFPAEFESVVNTGCKIVLNFKQLTATTSLCQSSVSGQVVQVTFLAAQAALSLFTVQLEGVKNPEFLTTTGPFTVWTKTTKDSQFTSLNRMFGTLAFTALLPTSSSLSAYVNATASGFTNVVSAQSTYTFNVKWDYWIDAGAWFRIVLPTGWSKSYGVDISCTVRNFTTAQIPPTGSFFCETSGQNVYLKGLTSSIDPSDTKKCEFALVVTNIINPSSAQAEASAQFSIDLMDLGTTNILQKLQAYNPAIVPGAVANLQATKLSYLAKDMNGNTLTMRFSFSLSHSVPQDGSIQLNLPQSTFASVPANYIGCAIISGISDKAAGNFATCTPSNSIVTVANIASIATGTAVVIQAVVSVAAADTETLTVTTFDAAGKAIDTGTLQMTRNYANSLFAQAIVFGGGLLGAVSTSVTFAITPTMLHDVGTTIWITFPPGFSVSTPGCQFLVGAGITRTLSSCIYNVDNRLINLVTATDQITVGSTTLLTISGVNFPTVRSNFENVYEFCVTTFVKSTSTDYNHGCVQYTLVALAEPTLSFQPDNGGYWIYQRFTLTFKFRTFASYSATVTPQVRISCPTADSTDLLWDTNLGVTGTPLCSVSGANTANKCEVVTATSQTTNSPATLILSMLMSVTAGTTYTMTTVLRSPKTAGKTLSNIIEVGYLENRQWKVMTTDTDNFATTGSASFTFGGTPAVKPATTTTILQMNPIVLTLRSTSAAASWKLAVLFPVGWDVSTATSMTIGASTCNSLSLFANSYAPMVLCSQGTLAANILPSGVDTDVTINGIKNPAYTTLGTTSPIYAVYSASTTLINYQGIGNPTATTEAKMTVASLTPDITEMSAKGVHYTFLFTTVNAVPAGGLVQITFPTQYSGFMTNYECQFGTGFVANTGTSLSCAISGQTITVSSLAAVKAATPMSITIRRINNPTNNSITGFYVTTAQSAGFNIDRSSSLSVSFPTSFTAGIVSYGSLSFEPSNAGAKYADFFMDFRAQHRVPEGATVQITVPFDFVDLSTAGCVINFMMASCTAAGHYINFITAQDITAATPIKVAVNKAFTLPLAKTNLFSVLVSYGGTTIDQTTSGLSGSAGNMFTPVGAALPMTVTSIDFFPNNQGEPATYTFSFSVPAAVQSTSSMVIWFPDEFDPSLNTKSSDLECWGNPVEFVGSLLNCKVSTFLKVVVTGILTIPANFQFSVSIGGVMNPISGKIGQFRFAVQDSTGATLHYQVNSGNLSIGKGPNPMKFKILTYANSQLRATNTLTFNFSPASNIPSSDDQGQIFIDLPSEFPLMNIGDQTGWELPCQTWLLVNEKISATNWNDKVQCINYNSNRIVVTGGKAYTALATQTIRIQISQVPGPQLGLNSRLIKIMTYDGVSKVLLDRNYGQLSYVDSFAFTLMGEELLVNSGATVSVMRGTCSSPLPIVTKDSLHPMRVDIQLTGLMPRVLTSRLSPSNVLTFRTSKTTLSFCIAVPADLTPGTYNMHWSKTGDDYYLESAGEEIYAPLAVTSVNVITGLATVTIGQMSPVVVGGHSLPVVVTLSNSPYNELIVTPTQVGSIDPGISFDPPSLQFGPGDLSLSFYIRANTAINSTQHEISWQLDGTDAAAYVQPGNSGILATGPDDVPPVVSNARYLSTRTSADVFIIGSKSGTIYYQIELMGSPLPSSSQLKSAYSAGKAKMLPLFQPSLELLMQFVSLAADTQYVVYVGLEDPSGRLSPVKSLTLQTMPDYQSVKFVIDFGAKVSVTRSTETIQSVLAPEVARALSVTSKRVTMFDIALDAVIGRLLVGSEAVDTSLYTKNAIVVVVANDKYVDMPSPLDIVSALTIDTLNSYLKKHGLTVTSKSAPITLTNVSPSWETDGNIWETDGSSITCAGSLLVPAYVHMVVLDNGAVAPTAQQVAWGLDGENKPTRHSSTYFDGQADLAYVKYSGLNENTRYDVYIAATSAYPGNNKAVSASVLAYEGVRTTAIYQCTANCPLYFVSDHESAAVLTLAFLLVQT